MKKWIALLMAVLLMLTLVACGGPTRNDAIDAFNTANAAFNEVAGEMNRNPGKYDQKWFDSMNAVAEDISRHKDRLESDEAIPAGELEEILAWCAGVETFVAGTKQELGIR